MEPQFCSVQLVEFIGEDCAVLTGVTNDQSVVEEWRAFRLCVVAVLVVVDVTVICYRAAGVVGGVIGVDVCVV